MKVTDPQPESTVTFLPITLSAGDEDGSHVPSEVNGNLPCESFVYVSPFCP